MGLDSYLLTKWDDESPEETLKKFNVEEHFRKAYIVDNYCLTYGMPLKIDGKIEPDTSMLKREQLNELAHIYLSVCLRDGKYDADTTESFPEESLQSLLRLLSQETEEEAKYFIYVASR